MIAFWFGCLIWGWIFYHALFHPKRFIEKEGDKWTTRALMGGSYVLFVGFVLLICGALLHEHYYRHWTVDLMNAGFVIHLIGWAILAIAMLWETWSPWPGYERKKKNNKNN